MVSFKVDSTVHGGSNALRVLSHPRRKRSARPHQDPKLRQYFALHKAYVYCVLPYRPVKRLLLLL